MDKMVKNATAYECPFCQKNFHKFIPWPDEFDVPQAQYEIWNKQTAICPFCYSMDRERMYRFYIEKETDLTTVPSSVLHIGSERSLRNWLLGQHNLNYVGGNVTAENGLKKIDVTSIEYGDETFDAVICSHVLERVPDDLKAMKELYRVMKNDGWGIVQVPIALSLQTTKENAVDFAPEHRFRTISRDDHVRFYAKEDFMQRLKSVGFTVHPLPLEKMSEVPDILKYGLSPKDILYVVTKRKASHRSLDSDVKGEFGSSRAGSAKKGSWWHKVFQRMPKK
jgi:SAM-dependent methyltransferase